MSIDSRCDQCRAHDQETKDLVGKLFSPDEVQLQIFLIADAIARRTMTLQQTAISDPNRFGIQRDIDFAGATLGKYMISLEPLARKGTEKALLKAGIALRIRHESCPHQEKGPVPS